MFLAIRDHVHRVAQETVAESELLRKSSAEGKLTALKLITLLTLSVDQAPLIEDAVTNRFEERHSIGMNKEANASNNYERDAD